MRRCSQSAANALRTRLSNDSSSCRSASTSTGTAGRPVSSPAKAQPAIRTARLVLPTPSSPLISTRPPTAPSSWSRLAVSPGSRRWPTSTGRSRWWRRCSTVGRAEKRCLIVGL
ncbi:MAG: hypothetical protein ACK6AD_12470 [Cyanobacteriota bacterium]